MSTDAALLSTAKPPAPRQPQPGDLLFEFMRGMNGFTCELRDHGVYGIEAQFFQNGAFLYARRFDSMMDLARTPRQVRCLSGVRTT